jgi:hypothetical protein
VVSLELTRFVVFSPWCGVNSERALNSLAEEQETGQKPSSNPPIAERRNSLFAYLGHAIRLSHEKMSPKRNSDSAKQAWGRLTVAAIGTYGNLIKDAEPEDIEERLMLLEEEKEKEQLKRGRI